MLLAARTRLEKLTTVQSRPLDPRQLIGSKDGIITGSGNDDESEDGEVGN